MFGYVSITDLSNDIRAGLHKIPPDIELIVGIPRSGMIPAYMIGLFVNRGVVDLDSFLANAAPGHGSTRRLAINVAATLAARHILLVDDSIASGASLQAALERIAASGFAGRITTCAAIAVPSKSHAVDISFRELPHPRLFEWNAFHHSHVELSCFDLDGILCADPKPADNDDGPRYLEFLANARPLIRPTRRIAHIVSARLEKYREPTVRWLAAHGIEYGQLHLIDLPSQAERIRLGAHCTHKARVYRDTGALLFYESDPYQAQQIARLSGKPVLCTHDMRLRLPSGLQVRAPLKHATWHLKRPLGRMKGWLRQQLEATLAPATRR